MRSIWGVVHKRTITMTFALLKGHNADPPGGVQASITRCISEAATTNKPLQSGTIRATKFRHMLSKLVWLKIGSPTK